MHEKVTVTSSKNEASPAAQAARPATVQSFGPAMGSLQRKPNHAQPLAASDTAVLQKMVGNRQLGKLLQRMSQPNKTGLPDQLKSGIESLSGMSMDDVKVHYNSSKPQELGALAYAQGNHIHLGPGQEQHLPHEAWHVVQQRQGRVQPTMQLKGIAVNDSEQLEREATEYGNRALRISSGQPVQMTTADFAQHSVAQLMLINVKTKKSPFGRVISSIDFEGRVPTSAESGQGDHTVADYLPKLMLQQNLIGKTHQQAAEVMEQLFVFIDENTSTSFKNDDNKMVKLFKDIVIGFLTSYTQLTQNTSVEGEDLNTALEDLLDAYLRLWNKRAGSAYNRSEGHTTGGGGGTTEKEAKKQIMLLGSQAEELGGDEEVSLDVIASLIDSIDFVASPETILEAAKHISMALELVLSSYPALEYNGSDMMYAVVNAYAKKIGLNATDEENVLKYCYESYYGEKYDEMDS